MYQNKVTELKKNSFEVGNDFCNKQSRKQIFYLVYRAWLIVDVC